MRMVTSIMAIWKTAILHILIFQPLQWEILHITMVKEMSIMLKEVLPT